MQVTETLAEGLKRAYTVVVPGTEVESRRAARFADLGKTVRLPGFRPGKVPLPVLRQRYGTAVTAEVIEQTVSDSTRQVLTDRGLRPALQPQIDLVDAESVQTRAFPDQDLTFTVALEVLPEIALPDFAAIALTRLKAEVTDEAVAKALANLAERNRTLVDLTPEELGDRGAAKGEVVKLDYTGRIDGTAFPGGTATDADVEVGGAGFIEGFAEQIEGLRPGETRTITVRFPDPYGAPELAGKEAQFELTAKAIRRSDVPAVDDELAKRLSFETLDELKDLIRTQLQREYDQLGRMRLKRELLDQLNDLAAFPAPEGLVEAEFGQIWARLDADRQAGRLDSEDQAKDEETLRREYRAIADRRVRLGLLLAEAGRTHNITVAADEMTRAVRAEAGRYPGQEAQVFEFFRKNPQAAETLRGPLFEDKVIDFVLELAQITDRPVTPEALAEEPDAAATAAPAAAAPEATAAPATAAADTPPAADTASAD
ncbi:MAG: trigger factor [Proteobacteria bacterium]|nr:trigger factor [Pseudomonadota bacterium]